MPKELLLLIQRYKYYIVESEGDLLAVFTCQERYQPLSWFKDSMASLSEGNWRLDVKTTRFRFVKVRLSESNWHSEVKDLWNRTLFLGD